MTKAHRLKKGLYTVTALVLSFGPFVTASGDSGIFTGTVSPFIPAKFTPATFIPETAATFTPAIYIQEDSAAFRPGLDPLNTQIIVSSGVEGRGFVEVARFDTPQALIAAIRDADAQSPIVPGPPFAYSYNEVTGYTSSEFIQAAFDPGIAATFTQATFTPNTPDAPATFTPATFDPGTLATFTQATFTQATLNPAEPVINQSLSDDILLPEPDVPLSPDSPIFLFTAQPPLAQFESAQFTQKIPAQFIQAIFDPGSQGTSLRELSEGEKFAVDNLGQLCSQDSQIACSLTSVGVEGITLQNLSPQAAIQAETIAITSPYQFIRNNNEGILQLIRNRRASPRKSTQQSFLLNSSASLTGAPAVSGAGFIGPLGISVNSSGSFGNRNNAEGQTGFQLNTQQASLMIDYSFNQKLIGGFSFEYLGTDRNLSLASGSLNSDSYRFAPFLLVRPTTNSYLTLMGGYALVNYDSTRTVSSSSGITFNNATANYSADQFFASLGGGYIFTLKDGWNLRGYGRGDFSNIDIQSFREKGGVASDGTNNLSLAMQMNGQTIRSVTSTLGAELSHAISTKAFIPVIIPRMRAEWVHEFENDGRAIRAGFIDQNGFNTTSGLMGVAGPERNWANLGIGIQMLFARSIVGYINYDRLIMQHANNNIISGGIRMNF